MEPSPCDRDLEGGDVRLPTERAYFADGPLDGNVYWNAEPDEVEAKRWDGQWAGGAYRLVEKFTGATEFLPGRWGAPGDAWFRWQKSGIVVSPEQSQTPNTSSASSPKTPASEGLDG